MSTPLGHNDLRDLIGSFALNALEPEERALVEVHIENCSQCREEADAFREIAAAMGTSVETPPAGVWDRIASQLGPERDPFAPRAQAPALRAPVPSPATEKRPPRPVRRRRRLAAVAAAAILIAGSALGVGVAQWTRPGSETGPGTGQVSAVQSALTAPGHRIITLASASGRVLGQLVVLPSGLGFLVRSSLPPLRPDETYQLWAMVQGQPISLGLLGQRPQQAGFTVAGAAHPSAFAVTVEPSGGVAVPDRPPVATGTLQA